ncbi:MAG TPA: response regulator [Desulfobulbaceae bacterium]|nr:response regulator [Desulfobulbaceae bacterium]
MGHSVLLIDDEPNFCTGLKLLLEADNYAVDISHSGQEALFRLENTCFDAVLLDLGLPDISGLTLAGTLKEKYPEIVVIILTGFATLENAVEALRGGVYDYLKKPFDSEQLLRTLARGIEYNALKRKLLNSEKRFRQLSRATWEGIIIYDEGNLLQANNQLCEMFGYEEKELLGRQIFDILLDRNTIRAMHLQSGPDTIGPFEAIAIRKDGSRFPVEIRVKQIAYSGRSAQVAAIRDVTTSQLAMQKQLALQQKLADAKRMESLGLMAGSVAHDLNNIMAGIITYPELLLMDLPRDFKYRKEIRMICDAGKRAAAVVSDLLTVARGANSKKEVYNLNTLVSGYINSVECRELYSRYPKISISSNMVPDILNISCSIVHVTKSIMNLVNNAAESIEGDGNILIETGNCSLKTPIHGYEIIKAGEYVLLTVADDGRGISSKDLPRIFDPFYSKKVLGRSGTGLGLAVVWNTVHDHGGYLDVQSSIEGTTFTLYFPVTKQKPADAGHTPTIDTYQGRGERILVVDDQENQREIACRLLARLGYEVHTVCSGEEAIEFVKETSVDLIILDMIMEPGINGCETYQRIMEYKPNQKAIIISGYSSAADMDQAKKLGINHFIKKPYTLQDLGQALRLEIS